MHLLQEQGLVIRETEPLEIEDRGARFELEGGRHGHAGRFGAGGDDPGGRSHPAELHLLGEGEVTLEVAVDARVEDERASASCPLQPLLEDEIAERAPDRDQAAAVALGEVTFGRQLVARPPLTGVERSAKIQVDLVVERHRSELETEACHPCRVDLQVGRRVGLRRAVLLITL